MLFRKPQIRSSFFAVPVWGGIAALILMSCTTRDDKVESSPPQTVDQQSSDTKSEPPANTAKTDAAASAMDEAHEAYIAAAASYLKTANKEGTKVAEVMAGAATGESTLLMVKSSIEHARSALSAAYIQGYKAARVPEEWAGIDREIERSHELHRSAFREYLMYWRDDDLSHIPKGNDIFDSAVRANNECIDKVSDLMAH